MLVLCRYDGESVVIGENVEVVVLESRNGKVRLGINAPDEVRVDRREISELRNAEILDQTWAPVA